MDWTRLVHLLSLLVITLSNYQTTAVQLYSEQPNFSLVHTDVRAARLLAAGALVYVRMSMRMPIKRP